MHIWHDTPRGREPFTLMVYGPYGTEYDVEVHTGHIDSIEPTMVDGSYEVLSHIGTVTIERNTHVYNDVWDWMNENA